MQFESAMEYLREGKRIYRKSIPDRGSLCGTIEQVYGSFYLTIYDVLADDWKQCKVDEKPEEIENE